MVDPDGVWFSVEGEGPTILVPQLNVDWSARDLSALTARFRVVVVAPRGFSLSSRPGRYSGTSIIGDLAGVADRLELDSYAVFGFSMNGVAAALLAAADARVSAAAVAGFPLTADVSGMGHRARSRNEAARRDPEIWSEVVATYDPTAAEVFWQHVADGPPGALASTSCPLAVWWSDADETFASLADPGDVARDLDAWGVAHGVIPGLGHDAMLDRLDLWLPSVADWLAEHAMR